MTSTPLLIIGIDGATFDLIRPWASEGYLPHLSRLMVEGAHGPLRAWPNMNSAAAWTSMVTGYNPGQHGIFDFGKPIPWAERDWRPTLGASRRKIAFWNRLSEAGDRVGIINVPISYPAETLNGFMIAGMDTPSTRSPGFCHPPELVDDLRQAGIDYVLDVPNLQHLSRRDPARGARLARQMIDVRAQAVAHLMSTRSWDVLMAVFVVTDRLQHYYWPDEDADLKGEDWAAIRDVYRRVDAVVGDLVARVGRPCHVLVVSDHGFGPSRLAPRCLNRLFSELGLLRFSQAKAGWPGQLLGVGLNMGRRVIPHTWQRSVAKAFPRLYNRAVHEKSVADIDWHQTTAFATALGQSVYLHEGGSLGNGQVGERGYERHREHVKSILEGLVDAETRRPLIREVHRREDLYRGPYLSKAGDLILDWDYDVCRDSLLYEAEGRQVVVRAEGQSGPGERWRADHRQEGIFIASGPGIRKGISVASSIYDVAPTVLHLRGRAVPSDSDGAVIERMFEEEYLRDHPVRVEDRDHDLDRSDDDELSDEDRRRIEERLRGLGYIA